MSEANVRLVRDLYEAFGRRDLPAIFGAFAPDIEIRQSAELPWGGDYQGHEGARRFFTTLTANITSSVTVERYLDAGDDVVVIGRTRGSVNATGAPFDVSIAHVWTIRDRMATRMNFYIDNATMLAALRQPEDTA